jgi:hypothetical protein
MLQTGIVKRWRLAALIVVAALAALAAALSLSARLALAEPAKPPAMTPAQYDQVVKLCHLKRTTLEPPAAPGGEPMISQRHCDPDWDAKMQCANDHFGKNGKTARTRFTSEWVCQIATPPSGNM